MKKSLLVLLILGFNFSISGQELMTIREVFDFEIGDKFQIEGTADNEPPNADRIEIVGKYYSTTEDTLSYIRFHDSYLTYIEGGALQYYFWTRTDTISYTSLDSSIIYFDQGFEFNQYIENSSRLCDSLINGCAYESGPGFENDYIINEYGKGLGQTYTYYYSGQGLTVYWANTLFYYKKADLECGVPDTLTVGIDEIISQQPTLIIYPNPANSVVNIKIESQLDFFLCNIMNSKGQIVFSEQYQGQQNRININHLNNGIYFLQIKYGNHLTFRKFIKE